MLARNLQLHSLSSMELPTESKVCGGLQCRGSAKFMLCSGIYLEQLQNSQSAAPSFTRGRNSLGRLELSLPTVRTQHQEQGDYTQRRSAEFLPFFPLISSINTPEFLQPLSQICYSFHLFLDAEVPTTPLYKCLLWITTASTDKTWKWS